MFLSQTTYSLDMIGMIVRDQDCNNFGEIDRIYSFNTFFMVRIPIPASINTPNSGVPR